MKSHVPDLYIELYRLGEADERIAATINADPEALERVVELNRDSEDILERYPATDMARIIRERYEREEADRATVYDNGGLGIYRSVGRRLSRIIETIHDAFASPAIAIGAVAVLVVALLPIFLVDHAVVDEAGDVTAGIERIKGLDPVLRVYRQSGPSGAEALTDESTAFTGDHLQVAYRAAGFRYGVIFSVDGNGYLTLHYPATVEESSELVQEGEVVLPYAYVLDDAPAFESFYMVLSTRQIEVDSLIAAVERDIDEVGVDPDVVAATVDRAVERTVTDGEVRLDRIDLRKHDGE